jgi:hypothetical protein
MRFDLTVRPRTNKTMISLKEFNTLFIATETLP